MSVKFNAQCQQPGQLYLVALTLHTERGSQQSASSDGAGAASSYAVRIWITPIVQQIAASRLSDYRIYIKPRPF